MAELPIWHKFFTYDPVTGVIRWKIRPGRRSPVRCGDIAGYKTASGSLRVKFKGKKYYVIRIIYEMFNGKIPQGTQIVHRNVTISDNRIDNLMLMTVRKRCDEILFPLGSERFWLKTAKAPNWNKIFVYNSESGELRWRITVSKRVRCGDIAGSKCGEGYLRVQYKGEKYFVHRIIYEMVHGKIPQGKDIDHRNGVKLDNRIGNLRPATQPENTTNSLPSCRNTSGYKGVSWCKSTGKWTVRLTVLTRCLHLGRFANKSDAIAVRLAAEKLHHGEFARSLVKETA